MSFQVGIEYLGFSTSKASIDLEELAKHKHIDKNKYQQGLGQNEMSVITEQEDIITLAYDAFYDAMNEKTTPINKIQNLKNEIDLLLFATESAIDNSKSAGCELHHLLNLKQQCRCLEVKQACYGGTGALMIACDFIKANPTKKALVIMSDIAFYGLNTGGEATQGCGAIAMIISAKPKIAVFNNDNVYLTKNKNDFYRPLYSQQPIYDGHLSIKCYLEMFASAYTEYQSKNTNFDYLITHQPFTKMLYKCCKELDIDNDKNENEAITQYNKVIGNSYTASLYIGLLSLLENSKQNLTDKKVLMFSYGSGAVCEMFSINIISGYEKYLHKNKHLNLLKNRKKLTYREYKKLLNHFKKRETKLNWQPTRSAIQHQEQYKIDNKLLLTKICNGIRYYTLADEV